MPTREEILSRLRADFLHYAPRCLKIRTKGGRIEPFQLNRAQLHIHARLEAQLAETGRVRALILKGRQQGCSTYVEARFYWKVTQSTGVRAFILTHLEAASKNLYNIARRFHDNCPKPVKPSCSISSSRELLFDKLDSGYQIGTARSANTGRSATLQYFHGSEVAFWAHADDHVTGILQAVPDEAGTEVILESTSAGPDGLFYKMAMAALAGDSHYQLIFIPWFWQEEYRKTPPEVFTPTAEEIFYRDAFDLTAAQLCWRRQKIAELGGIFAFRREYPATVEEAFHSDHPAALWNREQLAQNRRTTRDLPAMRRIVVAIDPAVTSKRGSDETGIIVAGLGLDGHGYILADLSGIYPPAVWAEVAVQAYRDFEADRIVAEVNQGGEMVEFTLRTIDPRLPYKALRASRGKIVRAEPVAALDMQGKIHHAGHFPKLEDQMCAFNPLLGGTSPDRVDARVWAVTELMLSNPPSSGPKVWM